MKNLNCEMMGEILRTTEMGVMVVNCEHHIVDINPHGAGFFEYEPDEMIGTDLADYVVGNEHHGEQVESYVNGEKNVMQGAYTHGRVFGLTKSGRHVSLSVKIERMNNGFAYATFFDPAEFTSGDTLTNALTRDQFFSEIAKMNEDYSLLFIDLNKFKMVNDTMGHLVGDFVLKTVSKRVLNVLRDTDIFCRYGGDEFIIVIPGKADSAKVVAKKIKKLCKEPIRVREHSVGISCSVGIVLSTEADNIDDLIHLADQRMYEEKV